MLVRGGWGRAQVHATADAGQAARGGDRGRLGDGMGRGRDGGCGGRAWRFGYGLDGVGGRGRGVGGIERGIDGLTEDSSAWERGGRGGLGAGGRWILKTGGTEGDKAADVCGRGRHLEVGQWRLL